MKRVLLFISLFIPVASWLSAQTSETFSDGGVSGQISFTHGTNTGHSVMAVAPNGRMAFSGPTPLDPRFDFGMLAVESQWIDSASKTWDEFYFTTKGNLRVLGAGRNVNDGTSYAYVAGNFSVDATQPGRHSIANTPTVGIYDNQSTFASISVKNLNSASKGAQLILGSAFADATGWSLQNDPDQNGTQAFAILNRATYRFPFQLDAAGRISLGFTGRHTATKPVEFADPKGAREGLNIYSKYKTSDLGRTNATASVDPDLTITLQPGIWKVSADLCFTVSGGTPGFWAYFNANGGNVSRGWSRWVFPDSTVGSSAKTYSYDVIGNSTGAYQSIGLAIGSAGYFVKGEALITVVSTTSLQLVWGQWSPQGQTTTLLAPSCLVATRVD